MYFLSVTIYFGRDRDDPSVSVFRVVLVFVSPPESGLFRAERLTDLSCGVKASPFGLQPTAGSQFFSFSSERSSKTAECPAAANPHGIESPGCFLTIPGGARR